MVKTVPKRRVSCTALVLVKASRVRRPLASTQWVLGTSSLIKDESKASIGVRPLCCSILCCLFKLYTSRAMTCSHEGFERINVRIWTGATPAADKVRTRSFTSLVILRWDGCAASRVSGEWLCSPHFTCNVQLPTWLRRPYKRKGQLVKTELEGRWRVSSVRPWWSSRVPDLPQCSNRMPIL